ncbi:FAD-dependent monooxygenase [Macrococcus equi]|uniref:FAD-dependent monooxygenase n=1 Tax=Macrococcus equi TaxID=3395462 RepID=UPI0039BDA704
MDLSIVRMNEEVNDMRIGIIGAGIGGLTAAIALKAQGHEVEIFEKRHVLKQLGVGLGIGGNAIRALKQFGIDAAIREKGKVLLECQFRTERDDLLNTLMLSLSEEENVTIQRADLHDILLEYNRAPIHLIKDVIRIKDYANPTLVLQDGSKFHYDLIIAADGIHSNIRRQMYTSSDAIYQGYTCFRGTSINVGIDDKAAIEYWGEAGRFGIVPLKDNQVYWFCCMNAKERDPEFRNYNKKKLMHYFKDFPDEVKETIAQTIGDPVHHDIYDINPLKSFHKGRVVLIGDAAHATTPNMGQGASLAIEDAVCLANQIKHYPLDEALKVYDNLSVKHTKKVILKSRKIGQSAQLENKLLINARNRALRRIPASLLERQTFFLSHRHIN